MNFLLINKLTLFIVDYGTHWRIVFFVQLFWLILSIRWSWVNPLTFFLMMWIFTIVRMHTMMISMFLTVTHLIYFIFLYKINSLIFNLKSLNIFFYKIILFFTFFYLFEMNSFFLMNFYFDSIFHALILSLVNRFEWEVLQLRRLKWWSQK